MLGGAGTGAHGLERIKGVVHVSGQQVAAGAWGARCGVGHATGFKHRAGAGAGDHGCVVNTRDVNLDSGIAQRAVAHLDGINERIRQEFATGQSIHCAAMGSQRIREIEFNLSTNNTNQIAICGCLPACSDITLEQISQCASAIIYGIKFLGIATQIIGHDIQCPNIGVFIEVQIRLQCIFGRIVRISPCLRRIGNRNAANCHDSLLEY